MLPEYYKFPAQLLQELGIREPADLDIEAIAFYCGATILYEYLEGCEAQIIGYNDRAIITVNATSSPESQRFSAGHEVGHWMRDRGKVSFACNDQQFTKQWTGLDPESLANKYSSDLLIPLEMFTPRAQGLPITFDGVRKLAAVFRMSLTATAIRLVEHGPLPSMLVCYGVEGRREWFVPSPILPNKKLWPKDAPTPDTYAYDLLHNRDTNEKSGEVSAKAWFEHYLADQYSIQEHSLRFTSGLVLSLLWWKDERMLTRIEDEEERRAARRSDQRWDE